MDITSKTVDEMGVDHGLADMENEFDPSDGVSQAYVSFSKTMKRGRERKQKDAVDPSIPDSTSEE